jgi:hypothetical protein
MCSANSRVCVFIGVYKCASQTAPPILSYDENLALLVWSCHARSYRSHTHTNFKFHASAAAVAAAPGSERSCARATANRSDVIEHLGRAKLS